MGSVRAWQASHAPTQPVVVHSVRRHTVRCSRKLEAHRRIGQRVDTRLKYTTSERRMNAANMDNVGGWPWKASGGANITTPGEMLE
jgi:hypothetical protein